MTTNLIPTPPQYTCIVCGQGVSLKSNGRLLTHTNPATKKRCEGSHDKPGKLSKP